jgi:hypothetical protein
MDFLVEDDLDLRVSDTGEYLLVALAAISCLFLSTLATTTARSEPVLNISSVFFMRSPVFAIKKVSDDNTSAVNTKFNEVRGLITDNATNIANNVKQLGQQTGWIFRCGGKLCPVLSNRGGIFI